MKPWLARQARLLQVFLQLTGFPRAGPPSGALFWGFFARFFPAALGAVCATRVTEALIADALIRGGPVITDSVQS